MRKFIGSLAILLLFSSAALAADEPTFTIRTQDKKVSFTRSDLLDRKEVTTLEIDYDPAFPKKVMKYRAVPLAPLFDGIDVPADATLQFQCLDGFSAPIARDRLLNKDPAKSLAFLAIELEGEKWPALKTGATPGPFYLVWVNPKASKIGPEEWPFQLAGFEVKTSLRATYPDIFPDAKLAKDHPANRGFGVFTKNCFSCHTMNLQGESKIGPDLNVPMSPTEYFNAKTLKALIRNPQSVRHWPQARMQAFPSTVISDAELGDLVAYLRHMTTRRVSKR